MSAFFLHPLLEEGGRAPSRAPGRCKTARVSALAATAAILSHLTVALGASPLLKERMGVDE